MDTDALIWDLGTFMFHKDKATGVKVCESISNMLFCLNGHKLTHVDHLRILGPCPSGIVIPPCALSHFLAHKLLSGLFMGIFWLISRMTYFIKAPRNKDHKNKNDMCLVFTDMCKLVDRFPYVVSLQDANCDHRCGGVLVDRRYLKKHSDFSGICLFLLNYSKSKMHMTCN